MYRLLISATAIVLAGSLSLPAHAVSQQASVEATTTQLPRTIRPTHYDVALQPDAATLTFDSKVAISIDVLQPTDSITLNATDLVFGKVGLSGGPGQATFQLTTTQLNAANQTVTFSFDKTIVPGQYRLSIDYSGKIGTQTAGLFALDYDTSDGKKRALYTQFETAYARRVIPSWDEPAYKATFKLEATVPNGELAVSNMPVEEKRDLGDNRSRVRFLTSPKMSTYLLFFGLGEFDRATAKTGDTEIGVIAKKGGTGQAAFALASTQGILQEYNDYFGTPYPLPKLDNIAAPGRSQFFSAMENWGAIFTFEHSILLDPSISTQADKQRAYVIAAHETAHQWFGNLVTMEWWDDLWLNESFASWMESRTTAHLHPEWNTALGAVSSRDRAMELDSLSSTHPVVQHIETVAQVNQAFDAITYQKGEAVIRMLEAYVGTDAWRTGIRNYMQKYRYSNAVSTDLWQELETAAGKPIAAIAEDFTRQPGVPLISVEDVSCTAGVSHLQLRQGEFSKDRPDKKALRWRVPVLIRPLDGTAPVGKLVSGGKATLTVPGCGPVIINAGQSGYFRTLYAPKQFATITNRFASIAAIDQLGILSDTWALGFAGLQPAADILNLVTATPLNADPQVWDKIAGVLRNIDDFYRGDNTHQTPFRRFAIAQLSPALAKTGWTAISDEAETIAILRNDLIDTLGSLGAQDVIAEARRRYLAQETDPAAIPAALRKTILNVVGQHADATTWEQLHAKALAEKTPLIKDQLYSLLAVTEDESLSRRALDLALSAEPGATNSAAMIAGVSRLHPDLGFDYAIAHITEVTEKLDAPSRGNYFAKLAERSFDTAMIDKVNAYAAAHLATDSRRSADTAIATIGYRIKVRNERLPLINQWLEHH